MKAVDTSSPFYTNEEYLRGGSRWLNPIEIKFECSDRAEKAVSIIFTTRLKTTRNFEVFGAMGGSLFLAESPV